jgi:hypothetical protein
MRKTLLISATVSAVLMIFSSSILARECSGDIVVPSLTCLNPMAVAGADVRFHMMEFQTCKGGKITELDRSSAGLYIVSETKLDDMHSIETENMDITYSDKRTLIDAKYRVDYLSFLMPTEIKMYDGDKTIEMTITNSTEPDFKGAGEDQNHFKGSFKIRKADGRIYRKGKLICFVSR